MGDLPGEYLIVTDDTVPPVEHPPRRVTVALRVQIKETLDEMVANSILATEWVSSMLVIVKLNKLRIQYSPKIMHSQEVAQEVLAPQEHASGEKKLNCALSTRSSKSYPQEAARSYESYRKTQIPARSLQ